MHDNWASILHQSKAVAFLTSDINRHILLHLTKSVALVKKAEKAEPNNFIIRVTGRFLFFYPFCQCRTNSHFPTCCTHLFSQIGI
jgi:hypothetical protein